MKLQKQNIFLIGILVIGILMFFLPFMVFKSSEGLRTPLFTLIPNEMAPKNIVFQFFIDCLLLCLSVVTLLVYKNGKLQYKLSYVLALLNLSIIVSFLFMNHQELKTQSNIGFGIGFYLPIIGSLFALISALLIKKAVIK